MLISDLQVLYHVLGVIPAYQASIGPALNELSLGLKPDEVAPVSTFITLYYIFPVMRLVILMLMLSLNVCLQALYGVYAKDVHVRMACLNAIKCIPAVASRSLPENVDVATSIWIALHDPEKVWVSNHFFLKIEWIKR